MSNPVVSEALESYQKLVSVLEDMSLQDVHAALKLEADTLRRKAIMCRLLQRAVRLNERAYKAKLIRRYFNARSDICG